MKAAIVSVLASLATAPALASPYSDLADCARAEARRLEPSGESAEAIAMAAIGSEPCAKIVADLPGLIPTDQRLEISVRARDAAAAEVVQLRLASRRSDELRATPPSKPLSR